MSDTSGKSDAAAAPHKAGAFDIRNIIGALMGLYGVILTLAGIFGDPEVEKTGGVNVVPEKIDRPDDDPTRPAPQRKRPPAH